MYITSYFNYYFPILFCFKAPSFRSSVPNQQLPKLQVIPNIGSDHHIPYPHTARKYTGKIDTAIATDPWTYLLPRSNCCHLLVLFVTTNPPLHANKMCKGKAIPLQVWTSPEGFRRLRLPDFKTVGT